VRPAVVADGLAECQVTRPPVPIVFCETRKLAQAWTYRFLAAASVAAEDEYGGERVVSTLTEAGPLRPAPPTPAEVRAWAIAHGHPISDRGRIPRHLVEAYRAERGG
jgi:hypothetical protein